MEEMKTAANEEQVKTEAPKDAAKAKKTKKNDEVAELSAKLAQKTAECEECNDRYMRMMAEYDNFRKRSAKEKEGVWADAYSDCIAHLLPILDIQNACLEILASYCGQGVE
jgi:molecular chaperone GrpE